MHLTSLMRKVLLYRGSYKLPKRLTQKNIMTTPRKMQEVLEDLKGNPYYDKYAEKIARVQKTSPEEFKSRIEYLVKKTPNKIDSSKGQYSQLLKPKEKIETPVRTNEPKLSDILKIDLIKDKSAEEITAIWQKYHLEKEDCIAAVIPAKDFDILEERSTKYKTFLFPLPRSQGYEFIMCQFESKAVHFTPLLFFQVHKENAPECLTLTHFKELKDDKGIVLMRGEYDKNVLNPKEAQCLANQLQMYYVQNDEQKMKLLERFTYNPDDFDFKDIVKEINNLSLSSD